MGVFNLPVSIFIHSVYYGMGRLANCVVHFYNSHLSVSTLYREHHFVLLISVVWAFYLCVGICVMGRLIDVGGRWVFYCVDLIQTLLISPSRFRIVTTLIFPMAIKITIILSSMKTRAILWTLFILFVMILQLRLKP